MPQTDCHGKTDIIATADAENEMEIMQIDFLSNFSKHLVGEEDGDSGPD